MRRSLHRHHYRRDGAGFVNDGPTAAAKGGRCAIIDKPDPLANPARQDAMNDSRVTRKLRSHSCSPEHLSENAGSKWLRQRARTSGAFLGEATRVLMLIVARQPCRNKLARLKEASRIEELGLRLMAEAEAALKRGYCAGVGMTHLQRALAFRDGLMIALLIRRPFRIKNFAALTLGDNFVIEGETANFAFKAAEMKGKRPMDVPFPPHLLPHLRRYMEHYRIVLLRTSAKAPGTPTDALWISRDGTPLTIISLHNAIRRRTGSAFGAPIPPHWFRDAAVTTVVRDKPSSALITGAILGHAAPDIATRHYNQALMVDAGRRHTAMIDEMIEKFDPASPDPDCSSCAL